MAFLMTDKIDDSTCPLCLKINHCDVQSQQGCWCMNTKVPKALLAKIPEQLKGKSCICNACIKRYQQQVINDGSHNH